MPQKRIKTSQPSKPMRKYDVQSSEIAAERMTHKIIYCKGHQNFFTIKRTDGKDM